MVHRSQGQHAPVTHQRRIRSPSAGYGWVVEQSSWRRLRRVFRRTTVDLAVADLTDGDSHDRSDAAIWVWARGRDRFSADEKVRLIRALRPLATSDGDPVTTAQAVAAMLALGADGAVEMALTALRDPRRQVRHIVAAQLTPTGDRRVVEALVALLDDTDGYVREAAIMGLEREGEVAALEPLRALVRREHEDLVVKRGAKRVIRALEHRLETGQDAHQHDDESGQDHERRQRVEPEAG
jgi:hypothetical protein